MATVAQALAIGRKQLRALEPGMVQRMLSAYEVAWRHVEGQLAIVDGQIAAAAARGETINQGWINRQTWYRQVQASIDREMARFTQQGVTTIAGTQASAVNIAQQVGNAYRAAIDTPFAGRVNAGAMQEWVSAIQPDSPVRGVLDRYGQRVSQSIETHITEGIGSGQGSRQITRNIVAEVGPDAVEGRLHTVVRTEGMRAYRGSHREDMEALAKDIPGTHEWEWFAALSSRTCPACLSRHGKRYPFNQYPDQQHPSCRCVVRLILEGSDLGVQKTGDEWLRDQPADVQRKVLRSPARYDAFQEGATLDDFTGVKHDRKWGDSVIVVPMRSVRRAA